MELLYVWIEEYKGISKLGFNISNRYDIKYENNILEVEEYKNWKSRRGFYGEKISNVTALIGKNGTGKSTLIDFISSVDRSENKKGFMIYTDKNGKKFSNKYFAFPEKYKKRIQLKFKKNFYTSAIEDDSKKILYYDNSINSYQVHRNLDVIEDISTSGLLSELGNNTVPFRSNDLKNMLIFLDEAKSDIVLETMGFPTKKNDERHLMEKMDISLEVSLIKENNNSYTNDIKENFINSFVQNTCSSLKAIFMDGSEELKLLMDISGEANDIYSKKYNELKMEKLNDYTPDRLFKGFYNIFNELKELLKNLDIKSDKTGEKLYFTIGGENSNPEIIKKFINFLEVDKKNSFRDQFFKYTWSGLSSGEEHFITFFSRIYSKIEKLRNEKNILFILDEPETFLHPEWSRQFLSLLITFLDKLFGNQDLSIQLIISSHSPYLTSDMAREDIVLLSKGVDNLIKVVKAENHKTLGANIHELYKESFFMDSTMGEFAVGKIKGVIEDFTTLECFKRKVGIDCFNSLLENINNGDFKEHFMRCKICKKKDIPTEVMDKIALMLKRKESSKYVIDQIGERVLSRKLGEKYREIFGEEEKIEDKMKSLYSKLSKEEREALKKEIGGQ
ncbi:MAG: AAA family ATPase [Psychrilyobacter sp.]|uniref:AAA family ATPase n=1 Tax=Psychrilyobacter sp. TaxID=2586924 RepID=UPI003C73F24F